MSFPKDPRDPTHRTDPEEPGTFTRDTRGDDLSAETPEADAAEQRTGLRRDEDEPPEEESSGQGGLTGQDGEANDADRAEQARSAGDDEDDDYR